MDMEALLDGTGAYKHLTCPICLSFPKGKVIQCKQGHILCEHCYSQVYACPQCRHFFRKDMSPIRNRAVELTIGDIKVKCPNEGCIRELTWDNFDEHMQACPFKIVKQLIPFGPEPETLLVICDELRNYLGNGDNNNCCPFPVNCSNKSQVLHHLNTVHDIPIVTKMEDAMSRRIASDLFQPNPKDQMVVLNMEDEERAIFLLFSTSGTKELTWTSYYLNYGEPGANPRRKPTLELSLKLVNFDRRGKGKEYCKANLICNDVFNINESPPAQHNNVLKITPAIQKRIGANVAKLGILCDVFQVRRSSRGAK